MVSVSTNCKKLHDVQSVLEEHGALDASESILCKISEHIDRAVIIHMTDSAAEFERQIRLYAHWDYTVLKRDLSFTSQPTFYKDRTVPAFTFDSKTPQIMIAATKGLDESDRWLVLMFDPLFQITFT